MSDFQVNHLKRGPLFFKRKGIESSNHPSFLKFLLLIFLGVVAVQPRHKHFPDVRFAGR